MPATGYTVTELMQLTGKSRGAIKSLLANHDIKPLSYEAIYPTEALEVITNAKRGRPTKKADEPDK